MPRKQTVFVVDGKKQCSMCYEWLVVENFYKSKKIKCGYTNYCRKCSVQKCLAYQKKHHEKTVINKKNEYERNKHRRWRVRNESARKIRIEVLEAYGNKCSCCEEHRRPFLTLDHIFGGGHIHRLQLGARGVYKYVKEMGFPKDKFRLLCMNCNFATRFAKKCPHEIEREALCEPVASI